MTTTLALDHVVVGVPDLVGGLDWFESSTGVRPALGGSHAGLGTHNAVASLGPSTYLELIAVDPDQRVENETTRRLGAFRIPATFGWAVRSGDLQRTADRLASHGIDCHEMAMSRTSPVGETLSWRLLFPLHRLGPAVPFVIDWWTTTSPAQNAPRGCALVDVTTAHPVPPDAQRVIDAMEVPATVMEGLTSGVTIVVEGPDGRLEVGP